MALYCFGMSPYLCQVIRTGWLTRKNLQQWYFGNDKSWSNYIYLEELTTKLFQLILIRFLTLNTYKCQHFQSMHALKVTAILTDPDRLSPTDMKGSLNWPVANCHIQNIDTVFFVKNKDSWHLKVLNLFFILLVIWFCLKVQ